MQFINLAGYKFVALERLPEFKKDLKDICWGLGLKGTILLSPEGVNIFVAGSEPAVTRFKAFVYADSRLAGQRFKESVSSYQPFKRMLVKIKKEIIVVLLDTRNAFEVATGTFRDAVHLNLKSFSELPRAADKLDESLKGKTIVAFCTGGIRCEKAAPVLIQKGFRSVFQLEGGILQYFEDCGDAHFKGRCFVFDQRIALDGNLNPEPADAQ